MQGNDRAYRAICFDLDGTLLPMDIDEFMAAYFARIAAYMAAQGLDAQRFMAALKAGTKRMAVHDGSATNEQAFWDEFFSVYGVKDAAERERMRALAADFYDADFPHVGDGFQPDPAAALKRIEQVADRAREEALAA